VVLFAIQSAICLDGTVYDMARTIRVINIMSGQLEQIIQYIYRKFLKRRYA